MIFSVPSLDYEFSKGYAHILITGQSTEPEKIYEEFKKAVSDMKQNGINLDIINRIKKSIYGAYVKEYNDPADIARMFLADSFKGINSFDYLEEIVVVNEEYIEQIFKDVFNENKMVLSVIKKA